MPKGRLCVECSQPLHGAQRKYCSSYCTNKVARRNHREKVGIDAVRRYHREWHRANPKKVRSWDLRKKYGMSIEQYEQMLRDQSYKCAICLIGLDTKAQSNQRGGAATLPCVDHDHVNGMVRGLLCRRCNSALSHVGDDRNGITRFVEYLGGRIDWKDN